MKSRDKHDRVGCKHRAFEYSEILRFLVTQLPDRSIDRLQIVTVIVDLLHIDEEIQAKRRIKIFLNRC